VCVHACVCVGKLLPHSALLYVLLFLLIQFWHICYYFSSCYSQKDSTVSRLLLSSIFTAIYAELNKVKTESEFMDVNRRIVNSLNKMLSTTSQFFAPFINCVLVSYVSTFLLWHFRHLHSLTDHSVTHRSKAHGFKSWPGQCLMDVLSFTPLYHLWRSNSPFSLSYAQKWL